MTLNILRKSIHILLIFSLVSVPLQNAWSMKRSSSDEEDVRGNIRRKTTTTQQTSSSQYSDEDSGESNWGELTDSSSSPNEETSDDEISSSHRRTERLDSPEPRRRRTSKEKDRSSRPNKQSSFKWERIGPLQALNIRALRAAFVGNPVHQSALTLYTPHQDDNTQTHQWIKSHQWFTNLDESFLLGACTQPRKRRWFQAIFALGIGGTAPWGITPLISYATFSALQIPLSGTGEAVAVWGYLALQYLTTLPGGKQTGDDLSKALVEDVPIVPAKGQPDGRPHIYKKTRRQRVTEFCVGVGSAVSTVLPVAVYLINAADIQSTRSPYAIVFSIPLASTFFEIYFRSGMKQCKKLWEYYHHWNSDPETRSQHKFVRDKRLVMIGRVEAFKAKLAKPSQRSNKLVSNVFALLELELRHIKEKARPHTRTFQRGTNQTSLIQAICQEFKDSHHRKAEVLNCILGDLHISIQNEARTKSRDLEQDETLSEARLTHYLEKQLKRMGGKGARTFEKENFLQEILKKINHTKTKEIVRSTKTEDQEDESLLEEVSDSEPSETTVPKDDFLSHNLLPVKKQTLFAFSALMLKAANVGGMVKVIPDLPPVDRHGNIVPHERIVDEKEPLVPMAPLKKAETALEEELEKKMKLEQDMNSGRPPSFFSSCIGKLTGAVMWVGSVTKFFVYKYGVTSALRLLGVSADIAEPIGWAISGVLSLLRQYIDYGDVYKSLLSIKDIFSRQQDVWALRKAASVVALFNAFLFSMVEIVVAKDHLQMAAPLKYFLIGANAVRDMAYFYQSFNQKSQRWIRDCYTRKPMRQIISTRSRRAYLNYLLDESRRFLQLADLETIQNLWFYALEKPLKPKRNRKMKRSRPRRISRR